MATRRLLAWATIAASAFPALPACTLLLNTDPVQCRDNASCARFPNAVCDVGTGVCVPRPPLFDGSLPISTGEADGGGDLALSDAGNPVVDGGTDAADTGAGGNRDSPPGDLREDANLVAQNHANGGCPDRDHDGVKDCLQTVLSNPDFGSDGTGWTPEAGVMQTAPGNAADNPAAGALAVVNTNWASTEGSTMAGATQCVAVHPTSWYGIYAEVQIPSDQDPLTSAGLALLSFPTGDCSGLASTLISPVLVGGASARNFGSWGELQASFPTLPNTASLSVRLVVVKAFQQAPARALFDNVLLRAQ